MGYRKVSNNKELWINYCANNNKLIKELKTTYWVFHSEKNFREFATTGKLSELEEPKFNFYKLKDDSFWNLFSFITNYFDMDAYLFDEFQKSLKDKD